MKTLELPAQFMDERSFCSMALLLFPTIHKRKSNAKQYLPEIMEHFVEVKDFSYEVFLENSCSKRRAFFTEPLIQHLWNLLISLKPGLISQHLQRLQSDLNDGPSRVEMLVADIKDME